MRKFLFAALVLLSTSQFASAQIPFYSASTGGNLANITANTFDTLTNTTAKFFITKNGAFNSVTSSEQAIYFYAVSLTGTPATVTVVQESSYDGATWFKTTGNSGTDGLNCDTLTFTPTTATMYKLTSIPGGGKVVYGSTWFNTASIANFRRLRVIPSGTQTLRVYSPKVRTASR